MKYRDKNTKLIKEYGEDILASNGMEREKTIPHHGKITVYEHTIAVTLLSLYLVHRLKLKVDEKSMVRGALLHDYYLYDRYAKEKGYETHRHHHPETAYKNAKDEFELNEREKDIILKHMFPWIMKPPKYRESVIVSIADKACATKDYIDYAADILRKII